MAVWVCLLRGVNLGARNKVNMPRLRVALAEAGFDDVRTLVQSGNVIARSRHRSPETVAKTVHEVIREHFDLEVPVIVRTPGQLREVLDWCPFPAESAREPKLVHVVHLPAEPDRATIHGLLATDVAPEGIAAQGREIVLSYASSMHESRLPRLRTLAQVIKPGTARNWRTLTALVEMTAHD